MQMKNVVEFELHFGLLSNLERRGFSEFDSDV